MSTQFDALLGDLETLHKALPKGDEVEDEKIEAAKAGGAETEEEGEKSKTEDVAKDVKGGKASGKKAPLAKSLTVKLEDGTEVEAFDGAEMVKSLTDSFGALTTRIDESDSVLVKAMGQTVSLIKAMGESLANLQTKVAALGNEGRGRKAVVTLVEKPAGTTLAKGGEQGINPDEFMAKATSLFNERKLSGVELAYIEGSFNRGNFQLPPALISKVMPA